MSHQNYKEFIYLLLHDELGEKEKLQLEEHLRTCEECSSEYNEQIKLKNLLVERKVKSPSDSLLNEARRELSAALRIERNKKVSNQTFIEKYFPFLLQPAKLALGGAAALLIGFLAGYLVFNTSQETLPVSGIEKTDEFSLLKDDIRINNVHLINKDLQNGEIEFTFDAVKRVKVSGSINDRRIQSILTYSMLNGDNPGLRLNTINALNKKSPLQLDNDVKAALINVLRFDKNPGVRREAIKVLRKYPYDENIKQAYLYVLLNDTVSGMRIEAMNSLVQAKKEGYKFDKEELSIFKKKLLNDNNNYIKYAARTVVEETN